jgi:hypothetical protein
LLTFLLWKTGVTQLLSMKRSALNIGMSSYKLTTSRASTSQIRLIVIPHIMERNRMDDSGLLQVVMLALGPLQLRP